MKHYPNLTKGKRKALKRLARRSRFLGERNWTQPMSLGRLKVAKLDSYRRRKIRFRRMRLIPLPKTKSIR